MTTLFSDLLAVLISIALEGGSPGNTAMRTRVSKALASSGI